MEASVLPCHRESQSGLRRKTATSIKEAPVATPVSSAGIGIKDLLDAGLHFGHQTKRWNPKMKRYIFDKRNGIHIIDLTQTLSKLDEAMMFVEELAMSGKSVLFVGTKKQAQSVINPGLQTQYKLRLQPD